MKNTVAALCAYPTDREACYAMLDELRGVIKPGMSTKDIDRWVEDYILKHDQKPAFKGYGGFPACDRYIVDMIDDIVDAYWAEQGGRPEA